MIAPPDRPSAHRPPAHRPPPDRPSQFWRRLWWHLRGRPLLTCAFCGQPRSAVGYLVAGDRACICDGCVALSVEVLAPLAETRCTFCQRCPPEIPGLAGKPGVYVCGPCAELCMAAATPEALEACRSIAALRAALPPTAIPALPILDDASASPPLRGALDSPPDGRTSLDGSYPDRLLAAHTASTAGGPTAIAPASPTPTNDGSAGDPGGRSGPVHDPGEDGKI